METGRAREREREREREGGGGERRRKREGKRQSNRARGRVRGGEGGRRRRERAREGEGGRRREKSRVASRWRRVGVESRPRLSGPGTSERRTSRLRETVCGAVSSGRDGRAAARERRFPSLLRGLSNGARGDGCEQAVRPVEAGVPSDLSGRGRGKRAARPRRSIRLERDVPSNGGARHTRQSRTLSRFYLLVSPLLAGERETERARERERERESCDGAAEGDAIVRRARGGGDTEPKGGRTTPLLKMATCPRTGLSRFYGRLRSTCEDTPDAMTSIERWGGCIERRGGYGTG